MPLRKRTMSLAAALAVLVAPTAASASSFSLPPVIPANPALACSHGPTTQAFLKFGDLADYSLAPNGSFEGSLAGWTFINSGVVAGNETVGIVPGSKSLLLGVNKKGGEAEAISPEFCITPEHPTFRFLTKNNSAGKTRMKTQLHYRTLDDLGDVDKDTVDVAYQDVPKWAPSDINLLAAELRGSALARGILTRISFRISSTAVKNGGVQIDNLLIDPYRRG